MGTMKFNNISTLDMGVVIQTPPVYNFPSREQEKINIEGRNGPLIVDKGSYSNTTRTYRLALAFRPNTNFIDNAEMIVKWLTGPKKYSRLEDSYDPDHFRLALFQGGGELQNIQDTVTGINATFDCKPQRFLKDGEKELVFTKSTWGINNPITINNLTDQVSKPNISIELGGIANLLGGSVHLYLNGDSIRVYQLSASNVNLQINSENKESYSILLDESLLSNNAQTSGTFPEFKPGVNQINLFTYNSAGVEIVSPATVKIIPNWWRI